MSQDFPLTRQLGLIVRTRETLQMAGDPRKVILAEDVEALLAKGVRVTAGSNCEDSHWTRIEYSGALFQALLVGIEKIRKETAEDVLRDYLKEREPDGAGWGEHDFDKWLERAKRVIEK